MTSESILRESFRSIGREYGYDNVDAEFVAFKELKIKWQRSYGRAEFKVSDYLSDAPGEIMTDIAKTLFSKISGSDAEYPNEMNRWMTSREFLMEKQPVYLRRSRNLTRTTKGDYRDIGESYRRLVSEGLIKEDPDVHISWTRDPNVRRVGYCSVLMKVVAISSIFDTQTIPEFVLDYVLYHEFIHIEAGFNPFGRKHGPEFAARERLYPKYDEAEEWLKRLSLYA